MQIRRRLVEPDGLRAEIRPHDGADWQAVDSATALGYVSPFTAAFEADHARNAGAADGGVVLPFQPLSFRDFMLFEQHNIDASRGYARRFLPTAARLASVVEFVTRRPPRAFRPAPLWYRQPIYYMSNAATFAPSGAAIAFPAYSQALDYELELGFVLKQSLRDASPEAAERAIGAFVVICDFSARDIQIAEMRSGFGPQKSKHFAASMSQTAVTADEVLHRWRSLAATVTINGEVVARPVAESARYRLGEVLAHASAGETLYPGELFGTGTFVGGSGMEIGRWLRKGDRLELAIEGVGRIEHAIR